MLAELLTSEFENVFEFKNNGLYQNPSVAILSVKIENANEIEITRSYEDKINPTIYNVTFGVKAPGFDSEEKIIEFFTKLGVQMKKGNGHYMFGILHLN